MNNTRKILLYILIFVLLCFSIPIIFTREIKETSSNLESKEEDIDYKEYSKIKLYHSKTNTIDEIELDEYIYGVVSSEMPATFELEALKAQAVVARTYTIYKVINNNRKT